MSFTAGNHLGPVACSPDSSGTQFPGTARAGNCSDDHFHRYNGHYFQLHCFKNRKCLDSGITTSDS